MVSNEVYTGAGASVTLIPEMEFDVGAMTTETNGLLDINNTDKSKVEWNDTGANADKVLVAGLYRGCMAKVTVYKSNGDDLSGGTYSSDEQRLLIKDNTARTITFNINLPENADSDKARVIIQPFGAPVYCPAGAASKPQLLSDGWLGLVQTISTPTIDVENKQYNLAMGITRDYGFQFKGKETIGNGSLDVAVNNGSWLYYVLGNQSITGATVDASEDLDADDGQDIDSSGIFYDPTTSGKNTKFLRTEMGYGGTVSVIPPLLTTDTKGAYNKITAPERKVTNNMSYTFTPSNGSILPSFALEVTNQKGNSSSEVDDDSSSSKKGHESTWARIYTGCQVNSLTLSFEEGMELKSTVDFLSRRVFDAPPGYKVKKGFTNSTDLFNYHTSQASNQPFMFSDGSIKIFGQEYARVKSGTITITNTLAPHSFVGNYDRSITSAHVAGQRTYELSLTMLITDTEIWDKLRGSDETQDDGSGTSDLIELAFTKNTDETITLKFDNYLVTNVDVPLPDDKGAMEVTMTASARTLNAANYTGKWVIMG